jgi:hypothetical protein
MLLPVTKYPPKSTAPSLESIRKDVKTRAAAGNQFRLDFSSERENQMTSHGVSKKMTLHLPHQAQLTPSALRSTSSKIVEPSQLLNKNVKPQTAAGNPSKKNQTVLLGASKKTPQTLAPSQSGPQLIPVSPLNSTRKLTICT